MKTVIIGSVSMFMLLVCGCGTLIRNNQTSQPKTPSMESAIGKTPDGKSTDAPSSAPTRNTTQIVKAEYFLKGICGAIHSIIFDENGNMYVGSLGDTETNVGKKGFKKIYKITADKRIETIAEIECTFITALYVSNDESVYAAVLNNDDAMIIRIEQNGNQSVIADGFREIGRIAEDSSGTIYVSSDGGIYKIIKGEKILLCGASGILDSNFKNIYASKYLDNKILRYPINNDGTIGEPEIILNAAKLKSKICDGENHLYALVFNVRDKLIKFDLAGRESQVMDMDVSAISYPRNAGDGWINNMAKGTGAFSSEYIYLTTWSGDILRVQAP